MDAARRADTTVPPDLLEWYQRWQMPGQANATTSLLAMDRGALWQDITKAWDARIRKIGEQSLAAEDFRAFGTLVQQRVDAGFLDPRTGDALQTAVTDIVAALENPIGITERYVGDIRRGTSIERAVETENAWTQAHPGVAERLASASEEAYQLSKGIRNSDVMLYDGTVESTYRNVDSVLPDGEVVMRAYPKSMGLDTIAHINELIARASRDRFAVGDDLRLLMDPDTHPLAKLPAVQRTIGDRLPATDSALINQKYAPDVIDGIQRQVDRYEREFERLAGEIPAIASRLALEPFGGWSDRFTLQHTTYTTLRTAGRMTDDRLQPADFAEVEAAAVAVRACTCRRGARGTGDRHGRRTSARIRGRAGDVAHPRGEPPGPDPGLDETCRGSAGALRTGRRPLLASRAIHRQPGRLQRPHRGRRAFVGERPPEAPPEASHQAAGSWIRAARAGPGVTGHRDCISTAPVRRRWTDDGPGIAAFHDATAGRRTSSGTFARHQRGQVPSMPSAESSTEDGTAGGTPPEAPPVAEAAPAPAAAAPEVAAAQVAADLIAQARNETAKTV